MSYWSELPHHLLIEIAERIKKIEDFVVFGVVCKTWGAAGKKEHYKGLWLWPGIPYLLLPVADHVNDVREFYSLVEGEIVASVSIPKFKKRKCYESLGWLLAVEEDGSMNLLNPFSSVEIPVPHQSTYPGYEPYSIDALIFVQKFVLSVRPNETSDFIVMIICEDNSSLAFWRPGDESWNIIVRHCLYSDVMYHGGHFYAIDYDGGGWEFTLHRDNPTEDQIVACLIVDVANHLHNKHILNELVSSVNLYILKTSLSLFMIRRGPRDAPSFDKENSYSAGKFQVYEVDTSTDTWTEIYDVGSMAIFVGHNATFAIDTSRLLGKIKGNHIYFSDDGWEYYHFYDEKGGGKDMGVYNLKTGTIESFYAGELLLTKICPYIWITPSF